MSQVKGAPSLQIVPNYLFPTVVWSTLFDDRESFNATLLEQIYRLRDQDPAGVENTNVRGWQSPNNVQNLPEFEPLNLRILQACQRIAESQHFHPDLVLQHEAWININPRARQTKSTFTLTAISVASTTSA